jgi:hypothetical protein
MASPAPAGSRLPAPTPRPDRRGVRSGPGPQRLSHPGGTMITPRSVPILGATASPYGRWEMVAAQQTDDHIRSVAAPASAA